MTGASPLPLRPAVQALSACALRCSSLVVRRRLHQPGGHLDWCFRFADGTAASAYRETVVNRHPPRAPAVLLVRFRLRGVRGEGAHALFRLESELNTVLFAGFPGFSSKLWLRHDEHGFYRGLYEWDGPDLAVAYVRALWWALAAVSAPGSIHYAVLPGLRRDEVLEDPGLLDAVAPDAQRAWWRLVGIEPRTR